MHNYNLAPKLNKNYIRSVWNNLPKYIRPTLLLPSKILSKQFGCDLTIATETFQYTGSFKFRPAYNLISGISRKDVIAGSSGNFGQAVALACVLLGKTCTVVMPDTTARVKIGSVKSYGAKVDLINIRKISRIDRVKQLLKKYPDSFEARAFDDYRVVAGNSTLGKEIFSFMDFDIIVVPVGGGGLSSGIIISRDFLNKKTQIIGVEPMAGNDAAISLRTGKLTSNEFEADTIADGARTHSLGKLNWEILRSGIEEIIEVKDEKTLEALRLYFLYVNLKVEPTGALSLGALLTNPSRFKGKKVCVIVSGGNVDPTVYAESIKNK